MLKIFLEILLDLVAGIFSFAAITIIFIFVGKLKVQTCEKLYHKKIFIKRTHSFRDMTLPETALEGCLTLIAVLLGGLILIGLGEGTFELFKMLQR